MPWIGCATFCLLWPGKYCRMLISTLLPPELNCQNMVQHFGSDCFRMMCVAGEQRRSGQQLVCFHRNLSSVLPPKWVFRQSSCSPAMVSSQWILTMIIALNFQSFFNTILCPLCRITLTHILVFSWQYWQLFVCLTLVKKVAVYKCTQTDPTEFQQIAEKGQCQLISIFPSFAVTVSSMH